MSKCNHGFTDPCPYCTDDQELSRKAEIIEEAIKKRRLVQFDYILNEYQIKFCIQVMPKEIGDGRYLRGYDVKGDHPDRYDLKEIRMLEIVTISYDKQES